jgi:hypothetical protein
MASGRDIKGHPNSKRAIIVANAIASGGSDVVGV